MLKIHSYLREIYSFVKAISKKSYRTCAIITSGVAIISIIALNSNNFGGSGKNKINAAGNSSFNETKDEDDEESDTEAKAKAAVQSWSVIDQDLEEHILSAEEQNWQEEEDVVVLSKVKGYSLTVTAGVAQDIVDVAEINVQELRKPMYDLSAENYEALLRIVEAEATGEDTTGKLLVANVILNRVNNNQFPDTVKEVVFQKCGGSSQFSPTSDGRYWKVTITEETREAVERAVYGEDLSQGALYFSARSKADPGNMNWFDRNLTWLFEYGGHEFYKLKDK